MHTTNNNNDPPRDVNVKSEDVGRSHRQSADIILPGAKLTTTFQLWNEQHGDVSDTAHSLSVAFKVLLSPLLFVLVGDVVVCAIDYQLPVVVYFFFSSLRPCALSSSYPNSLEQILRGVDLLVFNIPSVINSHNCYL